MTVSRPEKFESYKRVEQKALEIVTQLRQLTSDDEDIELALLVAIFEMHKKEKPPVMIAQSIANELGILVSHYGG